VTFRVLGTVGVETAGGVVVEVRGNPRALLAALCVAPNRPRPADVLIDAVWGEAGVPKSTLHVELSRLRRWLRDQGVDDRVIETTGDGYLLRVATDELDATLLLDLVHRGREALEAAETERAQTFLDRAVELVGVPYADLRYAPPFDAAVGELEEAQAQAQELLSQVHQARGRSDVGRLRRLVEEAPTREVRWQHLMIALYRDGRQTDALRVFRSAADRLAAVGLEPSEGLVRLEDKILSRDPGLDPLSRMVLPAELTSFVGRDDDVQRLVGLVGRHRLICITGPGGVGKSRLALRVSHAVAARFRDGAAFVSLAHVSDPTMVASAVATALGTAERSGVRALEAAVGASRDRSLLVVLDNCEHVTGAAAEVAVSLAGASPDVTVIATSQHDLRIPGAVTRSLAPLPIPAAGSLDALAGCDAVRLFVERAAERTRADVSADVEAVGEICRRLDGIPLAIELAASMCDTRSVPEILAELDDDNAPRVRDTTDAVPHHRSWRDSIAWSLGLLDGDERGALGRLSVFRGGFDRAAALDVCPDRELDRRRFDELIDGLAGKSVLIPEPTPDGMRFGMLESIRQASLDLVSPAERRRLVESHRAYFCWRAIQEGTRVYVTTAAAAVRALDADHDNIRAALDASIDGQAGSDPDLNLVAVTIPALMAYWTTQGHSEEAERWIDRVCGLVETDPSMAMAAGVAAAYNTNYDIAFARLSRAAAAFEAGGRRTLLGWARFQHGRALTVGMIAGLVDAAELNPAAELLDAARQQFEARGDLPGAALAGMFGGVNAFLRSDVGADEFFDRALGQARTAGSVDVEAMASAMQTLTLIRSGDFHVAKVRLLESASALRRDGNWLNAQICTAVAAYAAACAESSDAMSLAAEACLLQVNFGSREWDALTLGVAALVVSRVDVSVARLLARTLDREYPRWRQLTSAGFEELIPVAGLGPGTPSAPLTVATALRTAAAALSWQDAETRLTRPHDPSFRWGVGRGFVEGSAGR